MTGFKNLSDRFADLQWAGFSAQIFIRRTTLSVNYKIVWGAGNPAYCKCCNVPFFCPQAIVKHYRSLLIF